MLSNISIRSLLRLVLLFLGEVCCCSSCSNIHSSSRGQLDYAESLLADNPERAMEVLDSIDFESLSVLDQSQYTYVKTRAFAKTKRFISWADDMHRAAVFYEQNARPLDGVKAGDYYYFSGLSYKRDGQIVPAIVEWLKAAELLEKEPPVLRLYSTYENLFNCYSSQYMPKESVEYAFKRLAAARAIKDSVRICKSIISAIDWVMDDWPLDSISNLILEELSIAKEIKDTVQICNAYNGLAFAYLQHDSVTIASTYIDSALCLRSRMSYYQTAGRIRMKQGRIAEAVNLFLEFYPYCDISGKIWMGQYLNEIAKTEPGYEYLSSYADSVIYYNQKYDREEQSDNIQQAISAYYEQKKSEQYHQMLKSLGVAVATVAILLLILYVVKTIRTKRHIEHLQQLLQEEKAKMLVADEVTDPAERLRQRQRSLKLHCELFATTEVYRDLQLLYELKTGQVVKAEKRDELVSLVLAGFYEPIRPMLESGQFSHEDLFLCLMTYMKFHSREIAACLGVSDDAVRQRKRRIRSKLNAGEFDMFFTE